LLFRFVDYRIKLEKPASANGDTIELHPMSSESNAPAGNKTWEQRWHPLREEWVILAAHRNERPWTGETVRRGVDSVPGYSSDCYLCPGNARVHGHYNPKYDDIFVFDNDLPCVGEEAPAKLAPAPSFYRNRSASGKARVVCYSPLHNTTLAELPIDRIGDILKCWQEQYRELGALPEVNHVLIFENKGKVVGVSNPHPHNQIYATNFVFKTIQTELDAAARHWHAHGRVLFADIIATEQADGRRIIAENDSAIAFVPYFARYAYETYVAPKQSHQSIADLPSRELTNLAVVLQNVLVRFDNLWQLSFPYVLALHQAPTDGKHAQGFHFHIQIHPPLRTPSLLKYLAGPETGGGNFVSDTSPEQKAGELQAASTTHYKRISNDAKL
jgi:UDPglucose--hexose-1-phosphate uridylyltransferase